MQAATDKGAVRRLGALGWRVEENMRGVHYTTEGLVEVKKTTASLTREAESRSLGGLVEARQLVPSHEAYT